MKQRFVSVLGLWGVPLLVSGGVVLGGGACSTKSDPAGPTVEPGKFLIEVACTDKDDDIYADPGALPADKGAIIKCAKDNDLTAAEIMAGTPDYKGKPFTSGAHVYRVLYRTERGDAANSPGTSSALVYIPTVPRATPSPVVVVSHATRGQAPGCAASKLAELYQAGPFVGAGYAVIAPDLAGYANYGGTGNAPSAFAQAADVGKSTLDGAKALRKMFSTSVSDKIIIAGHSQGGGTALAALAISTSYEVGGTLAGVVAFTPNWVSQASWGALPLLASEYTFKDAVTINTAAISYIYTHGELLDGAGHGGDVFKPEKRAAVKNFVDTVCLDQAGPALAALGTDITDIYDTAFSISVKTPAGLGTGCGDAVCTKWLERFAADRPHISGAAAQVPILLSYGGKDATIVPDRMTCVTDRLDTDKANYKTCFMPEADHTSIVNTGTDYAADWIAARTLGAPEPAPCPGTYVKTKCATPPPND